MPPWITIPIDDIAGPNISFNSFSIINFSAAGHRLLTLSCSCTYDIGGKTTLEKSLLGSDRASLTLRGGETLSLVL